MKKIAENIPIIIAAGALIFVVMLNSERKLKKEGERWQELARQEFQVGILVGKRLAQDEARAAMVANAESIQAWDTNRPTQINAQSNTVFWFRLPTVEDAAKESVRGAVTNADGWVVTWDRSGAREIIEATGTREITLTPDGGGETNEFDLSNLKDDGCCDGKIGSTTTHTP